MGDEGRGAGLRAGELAVAGWVVVMSWFVILGSDLLWVVALGDVVSAGGGIPTTIPFASAPQVTWHNPIVLAELLLSAVNAMGPAGLAVLQLLLATATLVVLLIEGRRLGGGEARCALVVSLVVVGASAHLVITRLPSLSLVPFVLALAVMRRQHEHPDRQLWWLVPLYLVWGNLHGGVLVGLAVLGVFLVASPGGGPLLRRAGVGLGCLLTLVATSAGLHTPAYYLQALGNEAAARGSDLWARPDPAHPLDLALLLAALVLIVLAVRNRPPLWEWLATAGLLAGTASAGRNGIWLLLLLAPAAMRAIPRAEADAPAERVANLTGRVTVLPRAVLTAGVMVLCGVALVVRGPAAQAPGADLVGPVRAAAAGRPVLAPEPLAETLAQRGITVWAANPIDAFPRRVQAAFLDFLHDGTVPEDAAVGLVVVDEGLAGQVTANGTWAVVQRTGGFALLRPVG
ncbi:hypothetical protein [Nostocoides sp. Soil756]|jgi:hypothetical protein|uniref:hypothetical protein n=1 Tax=Nostocoides sp. Soil756 TaxID=1736399 RepID=UPI0006FD49F2|nr:hypothetical protein [Tetrasphaera sp. Soil756]KRE62292.1 hypothetical protein ASG78_04390 [Tetrasphaera sp. Soil756]